MDYILWLWIASLLVCMVISFLLYRHYYYMEALSPLYGGDGGKTHRFLRTIQQDSRLPWGSLDKIRRSVLPNGTITPESLQHHFSNVETQRVLYDYLQWI